MTGANRAADRLVPPFDLADTPDGDFQLRARQLTPQACERDQRFFERFDPTLFVCLLSLGDSPLICAGGIADFEGAGRLRGSLPRRKDARRTSW